MALYAVCFGVRASIHSFLRQNVVANVQSSYVLLRKQHTKSVPIERQRPEQHSHDNLLNVSILGSRKLTKIKLTFNSIFISSTSHNFLFTHALQTDLYRKYNFGVQYYDVFVTVHFWSAPMKSQLARATTTKLSVH